MAINRTYGFEGVEAELTMYNGQAVIDLPIYYYDDDEVGYTFPGYQSSFFRVYDSEERNTLVKEFTTQVTRSSNVQILNLSVSDMTFEANGVYYGEIGYVRSGYEIVLRYGKLFII
jgi:hypothetical protein